MIVTLKLLENKSRSSETSTIASTWNVFVDGERHRTRLCLDRIYKYNIVRCIVIQSSYTNVGLSLAKPVVKLQGRPVVPFFLHL